MEKIWNAILEYLDSSFGITLMKEGNPQGYVNFIFMTITVVFAILLMYRAVYFILGIFGKSRRYENKKDDKRYAFVLSARNEEKVIGNLIDSIRKLDYNQDNIDIIVVADNCSDNTYKIAKEKECIVYERNDLSKARKGYALKWLFEHLKKDLPKGIETYYAYVFMDSDNVMAKNFLNKLNDCLQSGYSIATSYRNAKNANDNWLSALSAMNWYRSPIVSGRARSIFNSCHQISGTGFAVRSYLLKDGWDYTMITEDCEMTTRLMAAEPSFTLTLPMDKKGETKGKKFFLCLPNGKKKKLKVKFASDTYLEIPYVKGKKAGLEFETNKNGDQALISNIKVVDDDNKELLIPNIYVSKYLSLGYVEEAQLYDEQPTSLKITIRQRIRWAKGGIANWLRNGITLLVSFFKHPRWAKYDIFWEMFPYGLFNFLMGFVQLMLTTIFWASGISGDAVNGWQNIWSYIINLTVIQYAGGLVMGIPIIIKEWNKVHFSVPEAIGYIFLWPFYDMVGVPISIISLFIHVTWKSVPHHVIKDGNELQNDPHHEK